MSEKVKRAIVFELNHLPKEQRIILAHLTYYAGRLWNQANYLVIPKLLYKYFYNV